MRQSGVHPQAHADCPGHAHLKGLRCTVRAAEGIYRESQRYEGSLYISMHSSDFMTDETRTHGTGQASFASR